MKKLFVIALLIVGTATFAQEKKGERSKKNTAETERMTPEQRIQLQVKKMTLDLNLSDSQQKEVSQVLTEQNQQREAKKAEKKTATTEEKKKHTADERFNMMNQILDEQIATKVKMKKILDEKQFEKWERIEEQKKERMFHSKDGRRGDKDKKAKKENNKS